MFILRRFSIEQQYFKNQFDSKLRTIFYSNLFQILAEPLSSIFISAFIWRTTGSLLYIVLYNIAQFISLPIGFYLNGFVLNKLDIRRAYMIGTVAVSATIALVVFFGATSTISFLIYGCLWGLGNGFYWANRNFLELQESHPDQRRYFYSILSAASRLAGIIVPFLAGWFIVSGPIYSLYSSITAYWILFSISMIFMLCGAFVIGCRKFESPIPKRISRFSTRPVFNKRRILSIAQGFTDCLSFVPTLLILSFFGSEGVLGTLAALVSVFTVIALYVYGRFAHLINQNKLMLVSNMCFLLCALYLAVYTGTTSSLVYILFASIFLSFLGLGVNPILLGLIETEMGDRKEERYSFIFDNELFLNLGRVVSLGFILIFCLVHFEIQGLLYISLFGALLQMLLLRIFLRKTQYKTSEKM